jgi:hypothetical protein
MDPSDSYAATCSATASSCVCASYCSKTARTLCSSHPGANLFLFFIFSSFDVACDRRSEVFLTSRDPYLQRHYPA